MKLKNLGSNKTQLDLGNGIVIFFSYQTPVAGCDDEGCFRTDKKWSTTTSKHINQWLSGSNARLVSQNWIDDLVK